MVRILADPGLATEVIDHGNKLAALQRTARTGNTLSTEDARYQFTLTNGARHKTVTLERTIDSLQKGKPYDRIVIEDENGNVLASGAGLAIRGAGLEAAVDNSLQYEPLTTEPHASDHLVKGQIALLSAKQSGNSIFDGDLETVMTAAEFLSSDFK